MSCQAFSPSTHASEACALAFGQVGSRAFLLCLHPNRARAFAKKLNDAPLAIVDKRRSAHNVSEVMNLIGDVKGKVRG